MCKIISTLNCLTRFLLIIYSFEFLGVEQHKLNVKQNTKIKELLRHGTINIHPT